MKRRDFLERTLLTAGTVGLGATLAVPHAGAADAAPNRAVFWREGDTGQRLHIRGRVTAANGAPVAGATIFVWQADGSGAYQEDRYRGTLESGEDGSYSLITILPGQYTGNKHIHVAVNHPDYLPHRSEMLFKGDADPAYTSHEETIALEEARINGQTVLLGRFDVKLEPI